MTVQKTSVSGDCQHAARLDGALATEAEDLAAWTAQHEAETAATEAEAAGQAAAEAAANDAVQVLAEAVRTRVEAARVASRGHGDTAERAAATLRCAAEAGRQLRKASDGLDQEGAELRARLGEALDPGLEREASEALQTAEALEHAAAVEETLQAAASAADEARTRRDEATTQAWKAEAAEDEARRRAEAATTARDAAAADEAHEKEQLAGLEGAWRTFREIQRATAQADKRLAKATEQEAAAVKQAETTTRDATSAEREYQAAQAVAARQRQAEAAAAAARNRKPGDDCPVCTRELPADWTAPKTADNGQAEQELEAATARRNEANAARAQAAAETHRTITERTNAERDASEAAGIEEEAWRALATTAGNGPESPRTETAVVEATKRRTDEAHARHRRMAAEQAGSEPAWRRAAEQAAATGAVLATAAGAIEKRAEAYAAARHAANQGWDAARKEGWEGAEDAESAKQAAICAWARRHEATERIRAAQQIATAVEENRQTSEQLANQERLEVTVPTISAAGAADGVLARLPEAADAAGLTAEDCEPVGAASGTIAAERAATIERQARRVETAAQRRIATANDQAAAQRARLGNAARRTGVRADPSDPEGTTGRIRQAAAGAGAKAAAARETLGRAANVRPAIEAARETLAEARRRAGQLLELAAAMKPGQFPKWLTLRRSTELLQHGSRRLERMSGGRYAFRDPRDTDEAWQILDRSTGASRSPATLSGGEQFLASLALALGMVETMGRRGERLAAFFLDEGFGSLDARTLEAASEALREAAGDDHHVGIITHVREAASNVPHVLLVERGGSQGSRVRWLSDRERSEERNEGLTAVR